MNWLKLDQEQNSRLRGILQGIPVEKHRSIANTLIAPPSTPGVVLHLPGVLLSAMSDVYMQHEISIDQNNLLYVADALELIYCSHLLRLNSPFNQAGELRNTSSLSTTTMAEYNVIGSAILGLSQQQMFEAPLTAQEADVFVSISSIVAEVIQQLSTFRISASLANETSFQHSSPILSIFKAISTIIASIGEQPQNEEISVVVLLVATARSLSSFQRQVQELQKLTSENVSALKEDILKTTAFYYFGEATQTRVTFENFIRSILSTEHIDQAKEEIAELLNQRQILRLIDKDLKLLRKKLQELEMTRSRNIAMELFDAGVL